MLNLEGEVYNFYAYTLYKLSKVFKEIRDNNIKVILDLTHGINYVSYLTFSAVRLILDIYSLGKKCHLTILNSDPYNREVANKVGSKNINIVFDSNVTLSYNYLTANDVPLRPYKKL